MPLRFSVSPRLSRNNLGKVARPTLPSARFLRLHAIRLNRGEQPLSAPCECDDRIDVAGLLAPVIECRALQRSVRKAVVYFDADCVCANFF